MAIDRRQFLAGTVIGTGALALGGFAPLPDADAMVLAGCFRHADGSDNFATLAADGGARARVKLPGRGHGMARRPTTQELVVFARRPGTFALVVDARTGAVGARITSPAGRHFQGHGVFTDDGRILFAAENHFAAGRGIVGVYDATAGYVRVGEIDAHGIGTHDLALMADGSTLALANGGILTHPDTGRAKLNLATMRPSLAYVDVRSGRLLADYRLADELHQLSIRHMAVNRTGTVVVVFQYEGAKTRLVPLVGVHAGEDRIVLPTAPAAVTAHMRHYCGSVAFEDGGRYFAVTSPRGNVATFWDATQRRFVGQSEIADVCGAAGSGRDGRFYLSSGAGGVVETAGAGKAVRKFGADWLGRVKWDNHLLALAGPKA